MQASKLHCFCTLLIACLATPAAAQQQRESTPAPPPVSASLSSFNETRQDDDDEKDLLAKQLDEFNKRLQALESGAEKLDEAQKDGSFGERIGELEESFKDTAEAIEGIDDDLGAFAKMGHGDETMKVFGRLHADWWGFPDVGADIPLLEGQDPQDRFLFRRMRLGVGGNINDNMVYKIELEFAGGIESSYRDAYLGWTDLPILQTLLVGNQKRPYGLDHLNSSRYNIFIERPFAVEAFNQDARRLGIASYGVSKDLRYNWRYGVYNQELIQNKDGYIGDNYQAELTGRFASTWWYDECSGGRGYGHFAVSGSWGSPDGLGGLNNQARYRTRPEARSTLRWIDTGRIVGADEFLLGGVEYVFNAGPLNVTAEYQANRVERLDFFGDTLAFHGGYAQVAYFLTGEHIPWERDSGTLGRMKPFENFFSVCDCDGFVQRGLGAWQVAMRYSYADFSSLDIDGGVGSAATLALNWHWNPYARMQMNYIVGNISSQTTFDGDYQIFGVRFMVDF